MQVVSLKSNSKLIKGHVYETDHYNNDPANMNYHYINIIGYGRYTPSDFTLLSGSPLPIQKYKNISHNSYVQITDINKGDIVVCNSEKGYRYLIKGGKYRINDTRTKRSSGGFIFGEIQLEGYKRWLTWNSWNFKKLTIQETREIALSQIFDTPENFSVEFKRKFDQSKSKNKILIESICKSILDKYRHHYDIITWGIEKNSATYKLNKDDFKELLDMPLSEIIEIYEEFS